MNTTFYHVSISISAPSAKYAYTRLCNVLAKAGFDFVTETYATGQSEIEKPTSELFPRLKPNAKGEV